VRVGTKGAGQVTVTSFSVPTGSLSSWRTWLGGRGIPVNDIEPRFGEPAIAFSDASGLTFELVATDHDARRPWAGHGVDADMAIRGLHSVTCVVRDAAKTIDLMTGLLGFRVLDETEGRIRVGVSGGGPGKTIDVVHDVNAQSAVNGLGTVHHVAMAIGTEQEQLALRGDLLRHGANVTEVRDRCYFKSIYFREPGGVLFEVATIQPGFTADEPLAALGRELKLPPWEEPHRADIEAGLAPVTSK
jgi:glyoxalase family protein